MYLNVKGTTDPAEIQEPVLEARKRLAEFATANRDSLDNNLGLRLVQRAQAVRNAEALARAQHSYAAVCRMHPENRWVWLVTRATERDDAWSGRGNDSTRESEDNVLDWIREQSDSLHQEERAARLAAEH